MGGSETDKPAKEPKTAETTMQEQSSATATGTVNPEWPTFQGYSAMPPHGFIASSPQAHPYMWGVQHIMPPYGTPPHPYVAMYPHGVYAHPSMPPGSYPFGPFAIPSTNGMAEASVNTPGSLDADGKLPEGKEKLPIKRSKGSLGSLNMITGKTDGQGKTAGSSADGACSKSGESISEGSSEGSDEYSQNDSLIKPADAPQNGSSVHGPQNGIPNALHSVGNPAMAMVPVSTAAAPGAVPGPTTNLNIGMDYWGTPASSAIPALCGKVSSASVTSGVVTAGPRDNMQWLQDERELKRQRRKQSNRESARRSRLRKQAECDELAQRAESLKEENANLRAELSHIRSEHEQLLAENTALKERLGETPEDLGSGKTKQHLVNGQSTGLAE
ncbi:bZIP transcription factor 16 [Dionaea muscipula]